MPDKPTTDPAAPDPDAPTRETPEAGNHGAEDANGDPGAASGDGAPDQPPGLSTPPNRNHGTAIQRRGTAAPHELRPQPPRRTGLFVDVGNLREHVGGLLRTMLGGYQVDTFGNFSFEHDGARVFVTVGQGPMGPHVGIFSVTNVDLDLKPDLAMWLATTNHRLGFGTLSYDSDNRAVWLRHTLLGAALDGPELQAAVASVASTAANFDDEISKRFGGRRFSEAPDEIQQSASPPRNGPPADSDDDSANVTGYL